MVGIGSSITKSSIDSHEEMNITTCSAELATIPWLSASEAECCIINKIYKTLFHWTRGLCVLVEELSLSKMFSQNEYNSILSKH
jgi:hypothetical protein